MKRARKQAFMYQEKVITGTNPNTNLESGQNLKVAFREIRDYFAGNVTGITRDESIAQNVMRILFCKLYDEKKNLGELYAGVNEEQAGLKNRIQKLFARVKNEYQDIFDSDEKIDLDGKTLKYVISKFQHYSLLDAERDVIGDAFEEIIGTAFRGGEGQFFTPRNVVQMIIDVLQPSSGERLIDPACGSGGFLAYALRHLEAKKGSNYSLVGIDKDAFLSKIARTYLALLGKDRHEVFCENSLAPLSSWDKTTCRSAGLGSFDVVLTNPPFGAKIPVVGSELLGQYSLGHEWLRTEEGLACTKKVLDKQSPQVLFIERCLQLLKDGGRMGIVLPEGVFGNPSDKYIWEFIRRTANVIGVVSLAQETFQPSTHTKTSVLFLEKNKNARRPIFMGIAAKVGHNKNGKTTHKLAKDGSPLLDLDGKKIIDDELPAIAQNFNLARKNKLITTGKLGFTVPNDVIQDHVFIPEYYDPEIDSELKAIVATGEYELVAIGDLVKQRKIAIRRGNEIGSQHYGTGDVPFVRTSDIVNWEIKIDPVKAVSDEVYEQYKEAQDIKEGDILFVNDGTFLIGRTAVVTGNDEKIIIQSHVRKLRVIDTSFIDPYYLFYLLNSKIVRKQIDAKTFVQATISTIGNRLNEIVLPISKNIDKRKALASTTRSIIEAKAELRRKTLALMESAI